MKKAIFALLLIGFLLPTLNYAQTTATKQETIKWLTGEGARLLNFSNKILYVSKSIKVVLFSYGIEKVAQDSLVIIAKGYGQSTPGSTPGPKNEKIVVYFQNLLYQDSLDKPNYKHATCKGCTTDLVQYSLKLSGGKEQPIYAVRSKSKEALRVVKAINIIAKLSGAKPYK